ncbi:Protein of unknown function [Polaromonas sp. OV174]|uniref:DUF2726 domain-containing protein n=1 Tax=Polaromonas sp. OV174 TaxID=1855300 RepID=UPI0008E10120|nr:DUF2726 domain-containing protein [Polaromonas sp. OV174]SFB74955.1 Protein of unknown function [Polaromonas sp. OV174]
MNRTSGWALILLLVLASMIAGALLRSLWAQRAAKRLKRIPRRWPLNPRALANTEEIRVWRWLREAFSEHHIMVKVPVIRFTLPRAQGQGLHWYKLLNGVYCTLTVCSSNGHVIGCIDVPGNGRISRSNRQLKQTLLAQCGIAYWVIESDNLPTPAEIRAEFLGDQEPTKKNQEPDTNRVTAAARTKLRASLDRQRQSRNSDLSPLTANTKASSNSSADSDFSFFGSSLNQENSFLSPLDSRQGELH